MAEKTTSLNGSPPTDETPVGYGKPPVGTRFQKKRSGNPRGRPRGRSSTLPYETVLGQMVTVRENGRERRITAAEAFILQVTKKGLAGDSAAARAALAALETAREVRFGSDASPFTRVVFTPAGIGSLLQTLGIAVTKRATDERRVRTELQPWIVEAALARIGMEPLTLEQQKVVWDVTRTPHKVEWPDWWTVKK